MYSAVAAGEEGYRCKPGHLLWNNCSHLRYQVTVGLMCVNLTVQSRHWNQCSKAKKDSIKFLVLVGRVGNFRQRNNSAEDRIDERNGFSGNAAAKNFQNNVKNDF